MTWRRSEGLSEETETLIEAQSPACTQAVTMARTLSDAIAVASVAASCDTAAARPTHALCGVRRTSSPLVLPADLQERCEGTVGDWCGRFFMQKPVPAKVRCQQLFSRQRLHCCCATLFRTSCSAHGR